MFHISIRVIGLLHCELCCQEKDWIYVQTLKVRIRKLTVNQTALKLLLIICKCLHGAAFSPCKSL